MIQKRLGGIRNGSDLQIVTWRGPAVAVQAPNEFHARELRNIYGAFKKPFMNTKDRRRAIQLP